MVMKDKLYKSNHKGLYYKTRKTLIASAIVLSVFTAVSVPTYINAKKSIEAEKKAAREYVEVEHPEVEVKHTVRDDDKHIRSFVEPKTSEDGPTYKFVKNN